MEAGVEVANIYRDALIERIHSRAEEDSPWHLGISYLFFKLKSPMRQCQVKNILVLAIACDTKDADLDAPGLHCLGDGYGLRPVGEANPQGAQCQNQC